MTEPFDRGAVVPGATPAEVAAYMVAAPKWKFASNPVKAVAHATSSAFAAYEGRLGRGVVNHAEARFWTWVAVRLVEAAGTPHLGLGPTASDLLDRYGPEPASPG